ncbi:MAG: SusC/RagA family TonB-linked outer membrane protein, partial [Bacteroidales bacterium]
SINYETSNFQWTSSFTFSRNRNELKELLGFDLDGDGKEDDLISEKLFIGEPLNTIYDYHTTGELWQLGEEIPSSSDLGTFKITDLNNDGDIDPENDRKIIGYNEPSFRFGLNNKLKYKNWIFSFFLNSVQGSNKFYLGKDDFRSFNSPSEMLFTRTFPSGIDYWLPENPDARYQKLYIFPTIEATRYIPRSFVRLQDISLSYNFSNEFLNKFNIESLRIFFNGKNLATWTNWTGWDPETGQGITVGGRPVLKSYSFGIDVKF